MNHHPLSRRLKIVALLFIPFLIAILTMRLKMATGPYWLGPNLDPSYQYLINSLLILDRLTPSHIDHPGTTLQILGAVVIKILNMRTGQQELVRNVITGPEYYLSAIHFVLLFVYILSIIGIGYYALKKTKNILFSLLIQSTPFLYLMLKSNGYADYVLPVVANVFPETLLMTINNILVLCVLKLYFDVKNQHRLLLSILFGVICGIGVATKVTFVPMLLAPLILLPRCTSKLIFIVAFLFSLIFSTLPAASRYHEMFSWFKSIVTHTGGYGSGAAGIVKFDQFVLDLAQLMKGHPLFFMVLTFCFLSFLYHRIFRLKPRKEDSALKKTLTFLWVLTFVAVSQVLVVAKHSSSHYLVPAMGLFGILGGLLYQSMNHMMTKNIYALFFLSLIIGGHAVSAISYQGRLYNFNQGIYNFSKKVFTSYPDCIIFSYYRSSSLPFALNYGNEWDNRYPYSKVLKLKYPFVFFYSRMKDIFHDFEKAIPLKEITEKNKCVLFYGSPCEFLYGLIDVTEIDSYGGEKLYKIKAIVSTDAIKYYLAAKNLESKKEYRSAFGYATKAKQLGFPKMDEYLLKLKVLFYKN